MVCEAEPDGEESLFWALDNYDALSVLYDKNKKLAVYNKGIIATGDSIEELRDKIMEMKARGFRFEGCVIPISCSGLERLLVSVRD